MGRVWQQEHTARYSHFFPWMKVLFVLWGCRFLESSTQLTVYGQVPASSLCIYFCYLFQYRTQLRQADRHVWERKEIKEQIFNLKETFSNQLADWKKIEKLCRWCKLLCLLYRYIYMEHIYVYTYIYMEQLRGSPNISMYWAQLSQYWSHAYRNLLFWKSSLYS